jgi:hypothetical protein
MRTASLSELKKELQLLPATDLAEICLSLARYKKDNKEYLTYLLLESYDKQGFVKEIRDEISLSLEDLGPSSNLYHAKKTLRKILRQITRYSRYINDKAVSCELLLHFCKGMKSQDLPLQKSQQLINLYDQQLKKIAKLIAMMHEDLQNDYRREYLELGGNE